MTIKYICIVLFSHKFKLENCIHINNNFERTCKNDSAVIDRDNFNAHAHSYNGSPPLSLPCGDSLRQVNCERGK